MFDIIKLRKHEAMACQIWVLAEEANGSCPGAQLGAAPDHIRPSGREVIERWLHWGLIDLCGSVSARTLGVGCRVGGNEGLGAHAPSPFRTPLLSVPMKLPGRLFFHPNKPSTKISWDAAPGSRRLGNGGHRAYPGQGLNKAGPSEGSRL